MGRASPEISVLVATYNQVRFLKACLEGVLRQSLPRSAYEVLVVDDGSTDSTAGLLRGYRNRLRLIHMKKNRGLAAACNAGLRQARGRFLVRVDSDDWLDPHALSELLEATGNNGQNVILLTDHWEVRGKAHRRVSPDAGNVYSWLAAGVLMLLEQVRRAGGYRPLFWEEVDLYLRLLERGARPKRLPKPLFSYRRHPDSMTSNRKARLMGWRELLKVWPKEVLCRYGSHRELVPLLNHRGRN